MTGICPLYGDSFGYGDMENWNTSLVTNMNFAFNNNANFNGDISGWDTSAVTAMVAMFNRASAFHQDISQWKTSNVATMEAMFDGAVAFDQEIRGWDVSKVTNFINMFNWATAFAAKYSTAPAFVVTPTAAFFTPPASRLLRRDPLGGEPEPGPLEPKLCQRHACLYGLSGP